MQSNPMTMQNLMLAASQTRQDRVTPVQDCLAYPGMTEVPPAFNRLAHLDFSIVSEADDNAEWDDYCPAYALGLLTYEAYHRDPSGASEMEMIAQWDELRGSSRLAWEQARAIIARSWSALFRLHRDGHI